MLTKIQKNILKNWKKRLKPYQSKTSFYQFKKQFDLKFFGNDENGIWYKIFNKNKNYWLETIGVKK